MSSEVALEAVVLSGGLGKRLRPITGDMQKVMAPIAGIPFLTYILHRLAAEGFSRVILAVGYKSRSVMDYFGDHFQNMDIVYSVEEEPLGTGGAAKEAFRHAIQQDCFVLNGDTLVGVDYQAMRRVHRAHLSLASIAVHRVDDLSRYGAVNIENGHVTAFREKQQSGAGYINAGTYLIRRDWLVGLSLSGTFSLERDVFEAHLEEIRPLAFLAAGDFVDIGIPEDHAKAQQMLRGILRT